MRISRIAIIVIFLGLIRCISEPFRLQYYATTPLTFTQATPYIVGALVAATGLFIMTLLSFWRLSKLVTIIAIATLIGMFIVKWKYQV